MPWPENNRVDSRTQFIDDLHAGHHSFKALCERYAISRKTGYKWKQRYREEGLGGLADRSRAPQSCPHQTSEEIQDLLIWARKLHPTWGPKKLLPWLESKTPDFQRPALSTATSILRRAGLIKPKRRRPRFDHPGAAARVTEAPHDVWTMDFKGQFRTRDQIYCYPFTVADLHTRYVLSIQGYLSTEGAGVFKTLEKLFQEHGLPKVIRSDNGSPFSTRGRFRLSRIRVWLMSLGIDHQLIRPASPQENGAHERMHLTLKGEGCLPPRGNLRAQQRAFNSFREEFNEERPHEALHGQTPASLYDVSPRPYTGALTPPDYPSHFIVKPVNRAGTFRFHDKLLFLSQALHGHEIALEEVDNGIWAIYFGRFLLATMDEKDYHPRP